MKTLSGRPPSQRPDELQALIDLLREQGVRSYLEIGARHGDTFFEIVMALPAGSRAVAVDLPGAAWGMAASADALTAAVQRLCAMGYDATAVFGDSQAQDTISRAAALGPFDFVFIDGDHRLAGVTADWINYGPMGNMVAFHDIDGDGLITKRGGYAVEVPQLWQQIRRRHRTLEIVGEARGMGIGVVWR